MTGVSKIMLTEITLFVKFGKHYSDFIVLNCQKVISS